MTNAEIILNYAREHGGEVVRKQLMAWFADSYPDGSVRSIDTTLRQLLRENMLKKTERGVFSLNESRKPVFRPAVSDEMLRLANVVRENYPYTNFCISQTGWLTPFMQHVPNVDMLVLEVDRLAAEPVFEDVRNIVEERTVLLKPTQREYHLYASGRKGLLVKELVTEAPLLYIDFVSVPSLEKLLVDATISPEYDFARGGDLFTLYENAASMYAVNKKAMLRYAARRGQKEEIDNLIKSTMP